ncbi:hypothetical protein C8F01DRAFT_1233241 [Mycena amicta]|nr:hypothetical protein C8F01DRAFT_1233241 [Mycena amicta]
MRTTVEASRPQFLLLQSLSGTACRMLRKPSMVITALIPRAIKRSVCSSFRLSSIVLNPPRMVLVVNRSGDLNSESVGEGIRPSDDEDSCQRPRESLCLLQKCFAPGRVYTVPTRYTSRRPIQSRPHLERSCCVRARIVVSPRKNGITICHNPPAERCQCAVRARYPDDLPVGDSLNGQG